MFKHARTAMVLTISILLVGISCGGNESVGARADAGSGTGGKVSLDLTPKDAGSDAKPGAGARDAGASSTSSGPKLLELTDSQRASLCDQITAVQGGYGRSVMCDGVEETTDEDQATCAAGLVIVGLFCTNLTVGDLVACANATGNDLCKYSSVPECQAARDCSM